jgi:hypothetical protein
MLILDDEPSSRIFVVLVVVSADHQTTLADGQAEALASSGTFCSPADRADDAAADGDHLARRVSDAFSRAV